jgi:hypothetical protein
MHLSGIAPLDGVINATPAFSTFLLNLPQIYLAIRGDVETIVLSLFFFWRNKYLIRLNRRNGAV